MRCEGSSHYVINVLSYISKESETIKDASTTLKGGVVIRK